jgi:hypothetical protein
MTPDGAVEPLQPEEDLVGFEAVNCRGVTKQHSVTA